MFKSMKSIILFIIIFLLVSVMPWIIYDYIYDYTYGPPVSEENTTYSNKEKNIK